MDKKVNDEIQKIYIHAVIEAQKKVEEKYGIKTIIDFTWESYEDGDGGTYIAT